MRIQQYIEPRVGKANDPEGFCVKLCDDLDAY